MEDNLSERQEVELLQSWFRANGPWAAAGILIGVGALVGYQQWHAWLDRHAAAASQKYEAALVALSRNDGAGAAKVVQELRDDYGRTPYADLATLAIARYDVESGKLPDAERYLGEVATASRDPEMRVVAQLRLARVQRAQGKPDAALATLSAASPGTSVGAFADLRGDLLLDKGDKAGALAAWKEALADKTPGAVDRELVELKVASVAPPAAVPAPAAAPATGGKP